MPTRPKRVSPPDAPFATVGPVAGKGVGVVAVRDLPPWTFVGVYGGRVLTDAQYADRVRRRLTTATYAVQHLGKPGHVVDPGTVRDGRPALAGPWAKAIAPRINEPGPCQRPNLVWVWNAPASRIELWTFRAVRAGRELTVCYGVDGSYPRHYCTSCVGGRRGGRQGRNPRVEPYMHVIERPGGTPVLAPVL